MQLEILEHFLPLVDCKKEILLLMGGAGSGKSYFASQLLILRALNEGNHKILILRKVRATLRNSCVSLIKNILDDLGIVYDENKTGRVITFSGPHGRASQFLFEGLDSVEKLKSIVGVTSCWIEEMTEISESDFSQIDLRLRGETKYYKQIIGTLNPVESEAPWIKRRFFDAQDKRAHVDISTAWDNGKIDDEYLRKLDGITDETYRKIYRLGEWAVAKGTIYNNWDIVANEDWPHGFKDISFGLDFGYNHKTALVKCGFVDDDLYWETKINTTGLTTQDILVQLRQLMASGDIMRYTPIYCDAAEPDRIQEIYRAGFNAKPAVKDVYAGIDCVLSKRLHIRENSQGLVKELRSYKWAENKDGTALDRVPVKFNDDEVDAGRYGTFSHLHHIPSAVGVLKWR